MRVLAVIGPTASGKSALAIALAEAVGGEVINADAMALYAGMDIGTAKPTMAERRGVTHHLFDIWPVTQRASVVAYAAAAHQAIDDVVRRGVIPIVVGGSGLYVRAALDVMDFPGTDPQIRAALEAEAEQIGPQALHRRLAAADPAAAAAINPGNTRRIVRALEVVCLTGSYTASLGEPVFRVPTAILGVERDDVDTRIERRTAQMFAAGLVDETRALLDVGLRDGVTAVKALGYAQALAVIDGTLSMDEAIGHTMQGTRRLVRRQRSWFRRDQRISWLKNPSESVAVEWGRAQQPN